MTESHAVLESRLIVTLSAFSLNVLLNGIDLRLILDQLLLDVIESVVYVTLKDLVLRSVMLHRVIRHLLLETWLILRQESPDSS